MKVFLGDLVHTWEKVGVWNMPLGIGYITAYAQKYGPPGVEYSTFKRPERLIEAIKKEKPDVVALSFYIWNLALNNLVLEVAKSVNPNVLTVGGGPTVTNQNATEDGAVAFFSHQSACDLYVINQGEKGFCQLLKRLVQCGGDIKNLKSSVPDGCLVNHSPGLVGVGQPIPSIRDLDEIPSPYLTGLMDQYFNEPFNPIIETNRSCPYRCTFCAWGISTDKLSLFSEERVIAELNYVAERCTKSILLRITDANFSILERDAKFAAQIYENSITHGFPKNVFVNWNKSRPDRVLRVAEQLGGLSEIGASMQSLNADVLTNIKRRNLDLDAVVEMNEKLSEMGQEGLLSSDLILGLPAETIESHFDANRRLIDAGTMINNFNLFLLPGTELDSQESRQAYFKKTRWRMLDNAFGIYDGQKIIEGEEIVVETTTMTEKELRSFRFYHFLQQFMWSKKWYADFLHFLWGYDVHPVDFIRRLCDRFYTDEGQLGKLYADFCADHRLENFSSKKELWDFWSENQNFERLQSGSYGKLNFSFTYRIILENHSAFNDFLLDTVRQIWSEQDRPEKAKILGVCAEVLRFTIERCISLGDRTNLIKNKNLAFSADILSWQRSNYGQLLPEIEPDARYEYEFYIPEEKINILSRQFDQFDSEKSVNRTLRMMSVYTSPEQFFYEIRPVA